MKKETKSIIIYHRKGSKANQVEEFNFDSLDRLTLGRDSANNVQFDPEVDTMVSRKHAVITWSNFEKFTIEDLQSTNGVFLNDERIEKSAPLQAGDRLQFGLGGPVIEFELNPRPASHMAQTQMINIQSSANTEELMPMELNAAATPMLKETIGRQTFERAIRGERSRASRTLLASLAGLIIVFAAAGFAFKDKLRSEKVIVNHKETITDYFDPAAIAAKNTNKVVFIEFGYNLIHTETGDDVYHRYTIVEDKKTKQKMEVALYIELNGRIEPFLGLKKDIEAGRPIAVSGATGTGFIVDKNGFILTNRHVAANWNTTYHFPPDAQNGILYKITPQGLQQAGILQYPPMDWVPAESKLFGEKPISGKILEGKVSYMDVTFAKNDLRTPAKIVRVSNTHDVAMIKIDLPGELEPVTLKEKDTDIAPGQKVVVMGYPGVSPDAIVVKSSDDVFNRSSQVIQVPDPTVTDCSIGKILKGKTELSGTNTEGYFSMFGDVYQLTTSETGAGNSGGPVFDRDGNVIAIFTSGKWDGATAISFALPIRYGIELMKTQRVIN